MGEGERTQEPSVEAELASTIRYLDLYLRQKTDLFLQHYLLDPFDYLKKQLILLSVVVVLFATGTLFLVIGAILFLATFLPLWAALVLVSLLVFAAGGIGAHRLFAGRLILETPTAEEVECART